MQGHALFLRSVVEKMSELEAFSTQIYWWCAEGKISVPSPGIHGERGAYALCALQLKCSSKYISRMLYVL